MQGGLFAQNVGPVVIIIKCLKVFKSLEDQLGLFEDEDGVVRAPVFTEQGSEQGKYDNQTESFQEKVTVFVEGLVSYNLNISETLIGSYLALST